MDSRATHLLQEEAFLKKTNNKESRAGEKFQKKNAAAASSSLNTKIPFFVVAETVGKNVIYMKPHWGGRDGWAVLGRGSIVSRPPLFTNSPISTILPHPSKELSIHLYWTEHKSKHRWKAGKKRVSIWFGFQFEWILHLGGRMDPGGIKWAPSIRLNSGSC